MKLIIVKIIIMMLLTTIVPAIGLFDENETRIIDNKEPTDQGFGYSPGTELITTHWGQRRDYNVLCPIDPSTNESFRLGCWSVAIGQIIRFYEIQSSGFVEYLYQNQDGDYLYLSNDLDTFTYIWDYMSNELDEFSTDDEKLHVSTLLYDTATVIQKNFGHGGYGTIIGSDYSKVRDELLVHFSAIDGLTHWDDDLTQPEIIDEIDHNRPIMFYMDAGGVPAHAVVLDGYRFMEFPPRTIKFQVHLNYGWYGNTDLWVNYSGPFPGPNGPVDYDNPSFRKGLLIRVSPMISIFEGPEMEEIAMECMFTLSTDYDSEPPLQYKIDWGDRTASNWLGPYQLGQPCITYHSWSSPGIYDIKVKTKNALGCQSDWIEQSTIYITRYNILLPVLGLLLNLIEIIPSLETYLIPVIELICS